MPYISRNENGTVVGLHDTPNGEQDEWLDVGDPEVFDFLKRIESSDQAKQALSNTDSEMIRVIEDLIDLLISKNVFILTELPEAVQAKLGARKKMRKEMNALQNLISDDDDALF